MTYTTNYNLKKPEATDPVNVDDLNDNADTIDTALAAKQDTLTAGTGIDITGNVISATGGGGGFYVGTTAPLDTSLLWIDPSDNTIDDES